MAKYNVMINRTRTIEESVEIEVSAKDEGAAQEKAEKRVDKANKDNKEETLEMAEAVRSKLDHMIAELLASRRSVLFG